MYFVIPIILILVKVNNYILKFSSWLPLVYAGWSDITYLVNVR